MTQKSLLRYLPEMDKDEETRRLQEDARAVAAIVELSTVPKDNPLPGQEGKDSGTQERSENTRTFNPVLASTAAKSPVAKPVPPENISELLSTPPKGSVQPSVFDSPGVSDIHMDDGFEAVLDDTLKSLNERLAEYDIDQIKEDELLKMSEMDVTDEQKPNDVVVEEVVEEMVDSDNTIVMSPENRSPNQTTKDQSHSPMDQSEELPVSTGVERSAEPLLDSINTGGGPTSVTMAPQPPVVEERKLPVEAPPFAVELITKYDGTRSWSDIYKELFGPYVDTDMELPIEAPGQNLLGLIEMVVRYKIMELLGWNPKKITKCTVDNIVCFNSSGSPLSQWHHKKICIENRTYCCNEQYMMHKKAHMFNDTNVAAMIMLTDNPSVHKSYGRKVDKFDQLTWDQHKVFIVYRATWYKFAQNDDYTEYLVGTFPKVLLETNSDMIWGTGKYYLATESAYLPEGKGHLYGADRPQRLRVGNHYLPVATTHNEDHKLPEIRKLAALAKTRPCGATLQKYYPGEQCIRNLPGPWISKVPALRMVTAVKYPDSSVSVFVLGFPAKVIIPGTFYDEVDLTVPVNYKVEDDPNMRLAVIRAKRAKDFLPYTAQLEGGVDPYGIYGMVTIESPLQYPNNELYQDYDLYDDIEGLSYDPNHEDRMRVKPYLGPVTYTREQWENYDRESELKIDDSEERYNPDDPDCRDRVGSVEAPLPVPGMLSLQEIGMEREKNRPFIPVPVQEVHFREESIIRDMEHVGSSRRISHNASRRGSVSVTVKGLVPDGESDITDPKDVDLTDIHSLTIDKYNLEFKLEKKTYRTSTTEKRLSLSDIEQLALMRCYYEEYREMPEAHYVGHLLPDGGEIRNGKRTMTNMLFFYEGGPCPLVNYIPKNLPPALQALDQKPIGCKCPVKFFDTRDQFKAHWYMYHCTTHIGCAFCLMPNTHLVDGKGKDQRSLCGYKTNRNSDLKDHLFKVHKMDIAIKDFGKLTDVYFIALPSLELEHITPASITYDGPRLKRSKGGVQVPEKLYFLGAWVNMDPHLPDPRMGDYHVPRLGTKEYEECVKNNCDTLEELKRFKERQGSLQVVHRMSRESSRKAPKRSRPSSEGSGHDTKRMVIESATSSEASGQVSDSESVVDEQVSTEPLHVERDPLPDSPENVEQHSGEVVDETKKTIAERLMEISNTSMTGRVDTNPGRSNRRAKPANREDYYRNYLIPDVGLILVKPWPHNPEPFDAPHWEWREFFHKASTRQKKDDGSVLEQHNFAIGHVLRYKRAALRLADNIEDYGWFQNDPIKLEHARAVVEAYKRDVRTITLAYNLQNVQKNMAIEEYKKGHNATRGFNQAQYIKHKRAAMDTRYYFMTPHFREPMQNLMKLAEVFCNEQKFLTTEMRDELRNPKMVKDLQERIRLEVQQDGERIRVRKYDYLRWEAQFEDAPFPGPDRQINTKSWGWVTLRDYQFVSYTEPTPLYKMMSSIFTSSYWKTYTIIPVPTELKPALLPQNAVIRLYQEELRVKNMLAEAQKESQQTPYVVSSTEASAEASADESQVVEMSGLEEQGLPAVMPPGVDSTRRALQSFISDMGVAQPVEPNQALATQQQPTMSGSQPQKMDTSEQTPVAHFSGEQQPRRLFLPNMEKYASECRETWSKLRGEISKEPPGGVPNLKHFDGIQLETKVTIKGHPSTATVEDVESRLPEIEMDANWHTITDDLDFDQLRESMATFTTPLAVQSVQMSPEALEAYRSDKEEDDDCWSYSQLMGDHETVRVPVDNDMRRFRARFTNFIYQIINADDLAIRNTISVRAIHDLLDNIVMPTTRRVQVDRARIKHLEECLKLCKDETGNIDSQLKEIDYLKQQLEKANREIGIQKFHVSEEKANNVELSAKLHTVETMTDGLVNNIEDSKKDVERLKRKCEQLKQDNKSANYNISLLAKENVALKKEILEAREAAMPAALKFKPIEPLKLPAPTQGGGDVPVLPVPPQPQPAAAQAYPQPISMDNLDPLDDWGPELITEVKKKFGLLDPTRMAPPQDGVHFYEHKAFPTHVISMDCTGVHFAKLPTTQATVKELEANLSTRAGAFKLKKIEKMRHTIQQREAQGSDEESD